MFSCGFDSIPFDLGVFHAANEMKARFGQPASRVRGRVRKMKGTFSGGTAASLKATMAAAAKRARRADLLRDPFALTPASPARASPSGAKPMVDEALGEGVWVAPFVMAAINTRNVHRPTSCWATPTARTLCTTRCWSPAPAAKRRGFCQCRGGRQVAGFRTRPQARRRPSREERETGHYDVLFLGEDAAGHRLRVAVTGDRDPGYGSTSKMIAEAAVCLLENRSTPGGIWTTAPALGQALIDRLQANAGLTFSVE